MHIASINISQPVSISFNNESVVTGIYKMPVSGPVNIKPLGVEGDTVVDETVHGGIDQAVYLYHKEDYDWWSNQLGRDISVGTFGENLTLSGTDEINWVIGDRLTINGVVLEITAPRTPCFKLAVRMDDNTFVKKFAKAARPGAYARVITAGAVAVGDQVVIEKTAMDYASVKEVFIEWHKNDKSLAVLKKALDSPIAKVHKAKIQDWYDGLA